MSKSKIKLQPISVRSPLPKGMNIPALPLPQQELMNRDSYAPESGNGTNIASTGTTDTSNKFDTADALPISRAGAGKRIDDEQLGTSGSLPELPSYIEGKARSVWKFLAEKANSDPLEKGAVVTVRATRREIARGAGIGSLDTVDRSLSRLQGLGFIDIERTRGVNDGSIIQIKSQDEHPVSQEKAWDEVANVLEQAADLIKNKGRNLSPNQLIQWSQLADRAFRLINSTKDGG